MSFINVAPLKKDQPYFMPNWFSAKDGKITFNGKTLSDITVYRMKQEIVRLGDKAELGSREFVVWMEAEHQLICAKALAEHQRKFM